MKNQSASFADILTHKMDLLTISAIRVAKQILCDTPPTGMTTPAGAIAA
jgi:hypothetical protein